jgi:hypothetical protein
MSTVVLDPGLLAYAPNISRAELFERVELLAGWSKISATQERIALALIPTTLDLLARYNLLPAHEPADRLLELTGLRHVYSPDDLIRPVYDLLERASSNHYCCITDELHDEFKSNPAQPWHKIDESVEELSQRALVMSHVENQLHEHRPFRFFASVLPVCKVSFSAQLATVDPSTLSNYTDADLPQNVGDEFHHVRSIEDLYNEMDPKDIWAEASSATDIKFAIQLGCRKRMINEGTYKILGAIPKFLVGDDFLPSLRRWQADDANKYASQTHESCVAAVLELPSITIKSFDKPKRAADMASPLRAHVTESGVALRLMMWDRTQLEKKRSIEFANVGGKHEEEISYTDPNTSV